MGKTVWHLTMSLDGFMADEHDSLAWMPRDAGGIPIGMAFIPTIGAILAGRRTYDHGISSPDGKPYGGAFSGPIVVVSHRPARAAAGKLNTAILGPNVGRQLLDAGLLDEILVHIAPVLIGSGIPAFALGTPKLHTFDVLERSGHDDLTTLRLRPR